MPSYLQSSSRVSRRTAIAGATAMSVAVSARPLLAQSTKVQPLSGKLRADIGDARHVAICVQPMSSKARGFACVFDLAPWRRAGR